MLDLNYSIFISSIELAGQAYKFWHGFWLTAGIDYCVDLLMYDVDQCIYPYGNALVYES
jgi:hypothetical protein